MHVLASIPRDTRELSNQTIPYLAVARVDGEDAGAFLQSQLSADILALNAGENTLACYCTPKGQVLGLLLVGRAAQGYLLAGSTTLLPGILRRLQMYVMRSNVLIQDAAGVAVTAAPGPAYRFGDTGNDTLDTEAWHAGELRAGITWLGENSSEKFIPQMLGFETIGAVSFNKGCYPGQEIVARARYLGKVKRKPLIIEVEGAPGLDPGSKLRVQRGGDWADAIVVDQARDGDKRVFFTVAREQDVAAGHVEIAGETYRCATM